MYYRPSNRRGARVAEGARLESEYAFIRIEGSAKLSGAILYKRSAPVGRVSGRYE